MARGPREPVPRERSILGAILLDAFPFGDSTRIATAALEATAGRTSGPVGEAIFRQYVVPFEVVSVLLLAALVGAIVVARRD